MLKISTLLFLFLFALSRLVTASNFTCEELVTGSDISLTRMFGDISFLSAEQEVELIKAAQSGDNSARRRLLGSLSRFLLQSARRGYVKTHDSRRHFGIDDLFQEYLISANNAISGFDFSRGVRLITYVSALSRGVTPTVRNRNKGMVQLSGTSRIDSVYIDSLNIPINSATDSSEISRIDSLKDESIVPTDNILGDIQNRVKLQALLAEFRESIPNEFARAVFDQRFIGVDGEYPSFDEIGKQFNRSKERVRQIEASLRQRLRSFFKDRGITENSFF